MEIMPVRLYAEQLDKFLRVSTFNPNIFPPEARELWEVLYNTGCRAQEVTDLSRWQPISYNVFSLTTCKFNNPRTFTTSQLTDPFVTILQEGLPLYKYMNYRKLQYYFKNEIGANQIKVGNKECLLHLFRHNYAKQQKINGLEDAEIQQRMGERWLRSAQGYIYSKIYWQGTEDYSHYDWE